MERNAKTVTHDIGLPDDVWLNVGRPPEMATAISESARMFGRGILVPRPSQQLTSLASLIKYLKQVEAVKATIAHAKWFKLYGVIEINHSLSSADVKVLYENSIVGGIIYDNLTSPNGIDPDHFERLTPVFRAMGRNHVPLFLYPWRAKKLTEIADTRNAYQAMIKQIAAQHPSLPIVLLNIATQSDVDFVIKLVTSLKSDSIYGVLSPLPFAQAMQKGSDGRPDLKALLKASGLLNFMFGSGSAPRQPKQPAAGHQDIGNYFTVPAGLPWLVQQFDRIKKVDQIERIASINGRQLFWLNKFRNDGWISFVNQEWRVPDVLPSANSAGVDLEPWLQGKKIGFKLVK